jgi:hypothetical protein
MTASYKRLSARLFKEAGWLCILFLSGFAGSISFGQQFQVEGTVAATAFDLDGKPSPRMEGSHKFSLCVSNYVWEMTLRLSDETAAYYRKRSLDTGNSFDMSDYDRLTFDGTNLYCFTDYETVYGKFSAKMRAAGTPIPAGNDNRAGAAVVELEVPHLIEGDSQIWLSYASGCYFKNLTTNLLEVIWQWGFADIGGHLGPGQSVKRRATWELQQDAPQLPKSVSYFLEDFGNFTNARYVVHSYKNFQNLTLPLESTLDVYRADPRVKSSTNMILSLRYVVRATAFKKLEKGFVFPPPVPVLTIVTDHRFNSPTDPAPGVPVPYDVRDRFLTKEEARNSDNYAKFKLNPSNPVQDNPASALERNKRTRWGIVGIMAVSVVIFLIIVIRSLRNAQKNT